MLLWRSLELLLTAAAYCCCSVVEAGEIRGARDRAILEAVVDAWIDKAENENYVARHECSFVQAGTKFYMFGGRESPRQLDTYDYIMNVWTTSASVPQDLNHFQATEYEGLVWVIGAFKNNKFPIETPAESIFVYDPANDVWMEGPQIPAGRRRGGGGLVVYQDKFYLVGGSKNGHNGEFVPWLDEYDPRSSSWTILADAPHARDHFRAAVVGDRMYLAGGRCTYRLNTFNETIKEVDVYDFTSGGWLTSGLPDDLPSPRAAAATAVFDGKIMVIGGESAERTAHKEVHALDTTTGTWSTLASLNYARHGTQAIVSGQGVYVAGGSPTQGAGNQRNMEVYNRDDPFGVTSVAGSFLDVQPTEILVGVPRAVTITHITGNQGVFVNAVAMSGLSASDFRITNNVAGAFLVGKGEQRDILVEYSGSVDGAKAQLNVRFSNDNVLSMELVGKLPAAQPTVPPTPAPITPTPAPVPPTPAPVTPTPAPVTLTPRPTLSTTKSPTSAPMPPPTAPPTKATTPVPTLAPVAPMPRPAAPTPPLTQSPTSTPTSTPVTTTPATVAPTLDPTSEATQVVTSFLMTFPPVTPRPPPVTPTQAPVAPTSAPTSEATQVVTSLLLTSAPVTESPTQAPSKSLPAPLTNPGITPFWKKRKCGRGGRKGRKRGGRKGEGFDDAEGCANGHENENGTTIRRRKKKKKRQ